MFEIGFFSPVMLLCWYRFISVGGAEEEAPMTLSKGIERGSKCVKFWDEHCRAL